MKAQTSSQAYESCCQHLNIQKVSKSAFFQTQLEAIQELLSS